MKEKLKAAFAAIAAFAANLTGANDKPSGDDINAMNAELVKAGVRDVEIVAAEELAALRAEKTGRAADATAHATALAAETKKLTDFQAETTTKANAQVKSIRELLATHNVEVAADATQEQALEAALAHLKEVGGKVAGDTHTVTGKAKDNTTAPPKYAASAKAMESLTGEGEHAVEVTAN